MIIFTVTGLLIYLPDIFTETDFLAHVRERKTISNEEEANQCLLHVTQLVSCKSHCTSTTHCGNIFLRHRQTERIRCPYVWLSTQDCSNGIISGEKRAESQAEDATNVNL